MGKGQITILILLGLVILIIMIAASYVRYDKPDFTDVELDPVITYVRSCVDSIAVQAVYYTSLQGGYFEVPGPSRVYSYVDIPVYWDASTSHFPTKSRVEQELFNYMRYKLPYCISNFTALSESGFDFATGSISGKTIIADQDVIFEVRYPITIRRDDAVAKLEKFSAKVDFNLLEKHNIASQIIKEQEKTPGSLPIGFITDIAAQNNFVYETILLDRETYLLTMIYDQEIYREQPYVYNFVLHYDWSDFYSKGDAI